jgi:GNAT superfamily N-acetyltransferase
VSISIRAAIPTDLDAISALVPRLRAFGVPPLRSADVLDGAERATLERALVAAKPGTVCFVAELDDSGTAGVAYAETAIDYFTREPHGHLGILAVAAGAEGRGVGRALLAAVEEWSRACGHSILALNVFAANHRARTVYERAGYALDTCRYYKELRSMNDASMGERGSG